MTYDFVDSDTLESADSESWDSDSIYDNYEGETWGEASRRRPARPAPRASGASAFRPRPGAGASGPVTQAQLEAALARVRVEIRANATGIKTLDGRVRTVAADQAKFEVATKKQVDKLRADLKMDQTLSALIPLFTAPDRTTGKPNRFASVAPLLHLVGPDLAGSVGSGSGAGGLLGNTNNLIAIGALLYASDTFK
jgi:hypothetical protein